MVANINVDITSIVIVFLLVGNVYSIVVVVIIVFLSSHLLWRFHQSKSKTSFRLRILRSMIKKQQNVIKFYQVRQPLPKYVLLIETSAMMANVWKHVRKATQNLIRWSSPLSQASSLSSLCHRHHYHRHRHYHLCVIIISITAIIVVIIVLSSSPSSY